jgi:hypothetical protein
LTCHPLGSNRVVRNQRGDGIECVEQKMRLDARFERCELRLGCQSACFRFVTFLRTERQRRFLQAVSENLRAVTKIPRVNVTMTETLSAVEPRDQDLAGLE